MHTHSTNVFGVTPCFGEMPGHHYEWPKLLTGIVAAGIVVKDAIRALRR